jgi:hypothetical protein
MAVGPAVIASSPGSAAQCERPTESIALNFCTITGTATVGAGTLSLGAATGSISWATALSGYTVTIAAHDPVTVVDATGSGAGWNLTASATPFTDSTGSTKCAAANPCTLGSRFDMSETAIHNDSETGVECATGATCTLPTDSVPRPVTVPTSCGTSGTTCTPATLVDAAPTTGMGAIALDAYWWVTIPANAHAGTYSSTITLTVSSGP